MRRKKSHNIPEGKLYPHWSNTWGLEPKKLPKRGSIRAYLGLTEVEDDDHFRRWAEQYGAVIASEKTKTIHKKDDWGTRKPVERTQFQVWFMDNEGYLRGAHYAPSASHNFRVVDFYDQKEMERKAFQSGSTSTSTKEALGDQLIHLGKQRPQLREDIRPVLDYLLAPTQRKSAASKDDGPYDLMANYMKELAEKAVNSIDVMKWTLSPKALYSPLGPKITSFRFEHGGENHLAIIRMKIDNRYQNAHYTLNIDAKEFASVNMDAKDSLETVSDWVTRKVLQYVEDN